MGMAYVAWALMFLALGVAVGMGPLARRGRLTPADRRRCLIAYVVLAEIYALVRWQALHGSPALLLVPPIALGPALMRGRRLHSLASPSLVLTMVAACLLAFALGVIAVRR